MLRSCLHACSYLALLSLCTLSASLKLPRDASSASRPFNLTATILDHQGVDISSSFEVKVYHYLPDHATSKVHHNKNNNTMHELNERTRTPPERPKTQFAQLVNACPVNETLVSSHCDPEAGGERAMQRYVYNCKRTETTYHELTGDVTGTRPVFRIREGHCQDDEMCVQIDTPATMAACVKVWLFDDFQIDKNGIVRGMLGGSIFRLDNMHMYATVSGDDKTTPLGMTDFQVDASNNPEAVDKAAAQSFRCRNCVELKTDSFNADTNALKVQARLMTSGAMAGILWLGLMSG